MEAVRAKRKESDWVRTKPSFYQKATSKPTLFTSNPEQLVGHICIRDMLLINWLPTGAPDVSVTMMGIEVSSWIMPSASTACLERARDPQDQEK